MLSVLTLATPVALAFLGQMLMGLVDTLLLGRLGPAELGGAGVGNSIAAWVMVTGIGLITGMDFPAASAVGANRPKNAYQTFIHGTYLAWALGIPSTLFLYFIANAIPRFGFDPSVVPFAQQFVQIVGFSMIPVFGFQAARGYLQSHGIAAPMAWLLGFANVLNFVLNVGLIWGVGGLPKLGYIGSPIATLLVRIIQYVIALAIVWHFDRKLNHHYLPTEPRRYRREWMQPILDLGVPGALQMLLEVGVFSLATAIAARLSANELAAHHIVLTTASMTFMFTLGISSAGATLVGQAIGAKDYALAKLQGFRCLQLGWIVMGSSALLMIFFAGSALRLFTANEEVIHLAKGLVIIAGFFQLSDGTQAVAAGVLRGAGRTRIAAVANFIGHWFIGLPISVGLTFYTSYRVRGLWVGLASGLTAVAVILLVAWHSRIRELTTEIRNR